MDFLHQEITRNLNSRQFGNPDLFDILYEELLADPLGVVKKFYHKQGIELSPQAEYNMKLFINNNPKHKHGKHKYCEDDFGITRNEIVDRFEDYMLTVGYKPWWLRKKRIDCATRHYVNK